MKFLYFLAKYHKVFLCMAAEATCSFVMGNGPGAAGFAYAALCELEKANINA